jgi:hypothetical protein
MAGHGISYLAALHGSRDNCMYKRGQPTPSYETLSYGVFGKATRL